MTENERLLIKQAKDEVEANKKIVESDYYRLKYHLMPPVGLLNDPNGFIQWNGVYHLFYQWMPFNPVHGAKFWGHYSSENLVNWKSEPTALAPSEWFEKNGCYSGSAITHDKKLFLFYTGNVKNENAERESYQCLALSEDGVNFTKKGPIVNLPDGYTPHFRDPKVWKKDHHWYMIIGAQTKDLKGEATLFKSKNLYDWELFGAIFDNKQQNTVYMWECPDLFELNGRDVLLVSPQGLEPRGMLYQNVYQSGYYLGELNYKNGKFSSGQFLELDRGFEFYAPQTTKDNKGRRLMFAWMGVPEQYEDQHPTIKHQWVHCMTLPRELHIRDNKLYQSPVAELAFLRKNELIYKHVIINNVTKELAGVNGDCFELLLDISKLVGNFEISLRDNAKIIFNPDQEIFTLERLRFNNNCSESRSCELKELTKLQIYMDTSSIEIFINEGAEVFTSRIFPNEESKRIVFKTDGEIDFSLKKWELNFG